MPVNTIEILPIYERLKKEWSTSGRGYGGVNAIKGFDFQLLSTIKKIIDSLDEEITITAETLSDMSEISSDKIVITQSKYCLSSSSVNDALTELWEIYCLILEKYPTLTSYIEFKILGNTQDLKDTQTTIKNWKLKHSDNIDISEFIGKVGTLTDENPYTKITESLLVKFSVENPWRTVQHWLGKMYFSIPRNQIEYVCLDIKHDLISFAESKKNSNFENSFLVWGEEDVPPENASKLNLSRQMLVVGQTPRKADLKKGLFAKRKIYEEIYYEFDCWHKNKDEFKRKIPVFWISGRSGAGKSVALLHLLSQIKYSSRDSLVAWFSDKPRTVDYFLPKLDDIAKNGIECFLCFDDPYAHERQSYFDHSINRLAEIYERLSDSHLDLKLPYIICCGPDEQASWCQESLGDFIDIHSYRLRDENESDIFEIKDWYESLTGQPVNLNNIQDGALLVQLVFEWSNQSSLSDFARHFKKRLNDDRWACAGDTSFYELISNVLAVNRLYSLFPFEYINDAKSKDPALAKAIHHLSETDRHLSLESDSGNIKFTHPHLADALYKEWYGDKGDAQFRIQHLTNWIRHFEAYGKSSKELLSPLWIISKLSNSNFNHLDQSRLDLIRDDLIEFLPKLYKEHLGRGNPLSILPVWTGLNRDLELNLIPNPLNVIGENLLLENIALDGFRLSCHKVIEYFSESSESTKNNLHRIIGEARYWHEWHHILFDYVRKLDLSGISEVLISIFKSSPDSTISIKISNFISQHKIDEGEAIQDILSVWLIHSNSNNLAWSSNFTDFAKKYYVHTDLKAKAIYYLQDNMSQLAWSYVWEALWRIDCDSPALVSLAFDWLEIRFGQDKAWVFVWRNLMDSPADKDRLIALAVKYCIADNSARSKRHLLEKMQNLKFDKKPLFGTIKDWLLRTPFEDKNWSFFWMELFVIEPQDMEVLALGCDWLCRTPVSDESWAYVRMNIPESLSLNDQINAATLSWLIENNIENPFHDSWQYFWSALWNFGVFHHELTSLGKSWLNNSTNLHNGWNIVWEQLWQEDEKNVELFRLGVEWLNGVDVNHKWWQYVWKRLHESDSNDTNLLELAIHWLQNVNHSHQSWKYIWEPLWRLNYKKKVIVALAEIWLDKCAPEASGRIYVERKVNSFRKGLKQNKKASHAPVKPHTNINMEEKIKLLESKFNVKR